MLFICSPSFGILDQWLPVIDSLSREHGVGVHILFPEQKSAANIDPRDLTYVMGNEVFKSATFFSIYRQWIRAKSLADARKLAAFSTVDKFAKRFNNRSPVPLAGKVVQRVRDMVAAPKGVDAEVLPLAAVRGNIKAVLFDLHISPEPYFKELLQVFGDLPWFSLRHGPNIFSGDTIPEAGLNVPENVTAYLHGAVESVPYQKHFGLAPEQCKVVGVPRHEKFWIDRICTEVKSDLPEAFLQRNKGYVFLISRPGTTRHFPMDRKRIAIQELKQLVIEELGCGLVVKMHPKEMQEGLYEELLGKERQGVDWVYSKNHPFYLGRNSRFSVAYLTSVCADMIVADSPMIERLDLRGFDQSVSSRITFDAQGAPQMQYLRDGLVLGACNLEQLRQQAAAIAADREGVLARLREGYAGVFAPCEGAVQQITQDVLAGLAKV